jgi:hypothetical protein
VHNLGHSIAEWQLRARLIVDVIVLLQKPLQRLVTLDIVLLETEDLEGLLLRYETALDTQTLLSHRLAALVGEFLRLGLVVLLVDELEDPLVSFRDGQWPNHLLKCGELARLVGLSLLLACSKIEGLHWHALISLLSLILALVFDDFVDLPLGRESAFLHLDVLLSE